MSYIKPLRGTKIFTCPHCGVLARQHHKSLPESMDGNYGYSDQHFLCLTHCEACDRYAVWINNKLVHPHIGSAPQHNRDLPEDVLKDYMEAASISNLSPKGAAALLRAAIQKLCIHLGGTGDNLNEDIKLLGENGLPPKIQKSLDIVRLIGDSAVKSGRIDTDNPEIVDSLFALINVISETMITVPKQSEELYQGLRKGALKAMEERNK